MKRRQKRLKDPDAMSLLLLFLPSIAAFMGPVLRGKWNEWSYGKWTKDQMKRALMKAALYLRELHEEYETVKVATGERSAPAVPGSVQINLDQRTIHEIHWKVYTATSGLLSQYDAIAEFVMHLRKAEAHDLIARISELQSMFRRTLRAETIEELRDELGKLLDYCERLNADMAATL